MNNSVDSIWLELGFKNQKKILVGGLYRVWQHMGQGANKESLTPSAQLDRWKMFVSQWEKALDEKKETIVLGDVNVEWLCCCSEDQPACPRQAAKWSAAKPLLEEFNRRIAPHGVIQAVRGITRSARGQADSALDLIFTSVPQKLSEAKTLVRSYSDHRLVLATRFTKNIISSPRYVKKRSFKGFDENKFIEEVRNTSMLDVYLSSDANEAAELLAKKLNAILDVMAPVKKIQLRHSFAPWISEECKAEMTARDAANKTASESGLDTDWHHFRQIRNSVTRRVRKEKEAWRRGKMEGCQANSSSCWKNVMGWLSWSSSGSPH